MSGADVVSLQRVRSARRAKAKKAQILCRNGHHRWVEDKTTRFDTHKGKLITRFVCERCGIEKTRST